MKSCRLIEDTNYQNTQIRRCHGGDGASMRTATQARLENTGHVELGVGDGVLGKLAGEDGANGGLDLAGGGSHGG